MSVTHIPLQVAEKVQGLPLGKQRLQVRAEFELNEKPRGEAGSENPNDLPVGFGVKNVKKKTAFQGIDEKTEACRWDRSDVS